MVNNSTIGLTVALLIFILTASSFIYSFGQDEVLFPDTLVQDNVTTEMTETSVFTSMSESLDNIEGTIEDIPYGIGVAMVTFIASLIIIVGIFWARGV